MWNKCVSLSCFKLLVLHWFVTACYGYFYCFNYVKTKGYIISCSKQEHNYKSEIGSVCVKWYNVRHLHVSHCAISILCLNDSQRLCCAMCSCRQGFILCEWPLARNDSGSVSVRAAVMIVVAEERHWCLNVRVRGRCRWMYQMVFYLRSWFPKTR